MLAAGHTSAGRSLGCALSDHGRAFVSTSTPLQYGGPLRAFVSKFINSRFDPAGMTDNPRIRLAEGPMSSHRRTPRLDAGSVRGRAAPATPETDAAIRAAASGVFVR